MTVQTKTVQKIIVHDVSLPQVAQAAQIVLMVLKASGCSVWEQFVSSPEAQSRVRLNAAQQALLDTHPYLLGYLRSTPAVTVAVCDGCGRFLFTATNGASKSKCNLTGGCKGSMFRTSSMLPKKVAA